MNPIVIALIMIVLAAAITIFNKWYSDQKEIKEKSKMMDEKMSYSYKFTEDISDEEYKKQVLNMLNLINMNLVDQEMKKNKEIEHLKDIQFSVNFIAIVILLSIVIKIIMIATGASVISNLF